MCMSYVTRSPTLVGHAWLIWLCSVALADEERNGAAAAAGSVATNDAAMSAVATPGRRNNRKGARIQGAIRHTRNTPSSSGHRLRCRGYAAAGCVPPLVGARGVGTSAGAVRPARPEIRLITRRMTLDLGCMTAGHGCMTLGLGCIATVGQSRYPCPTRTAAGTILACGVRRRSSARCGRRAPVIFHRRARRDDNRSEADRYAAVAGAPAGQGIRDRASAADHGCEADRHALHGHVVRVLPDRRLHGAAHARRARPAGPAVPLA